MADVSVAPSDAEWMQLALGEAQRASQAGEVPVGAVLVAAGIELGRGRNSTIHSRDPSAHAEILALRDGAGRIGNHRTGGTLYVTLEPCVMCMGAMVQARIERLVFAAADPKAGAARSLYRIAEDARLNHRFSVEGGLLADEAGALLREFFKQRRAI
jgi:tRNA(adenine34) deaminase